MEAGEHDYLDFLAAKACVAPFAGFEVAEDDLNAWLRPHCRAIVRYLEAAEREAEVPTLFDLMNAEQAA